MVLKHIDLEQENLTLDQLLAQLDVDTEIVLTKGNIRIARIMTESTTQAVTNRVLGLHEGQGWISDDFTN